MLFNLHLLESTELQELFIRKSESLLDIMGGDKKEKEVTELIRELTDIHQQLKGRQKNLPDS